MGREKVSSMRCTVVMIELKKEKFTAETTEIAEKR